MDILIVIQSEDGGLLASISYTNCFIFNDVNSTDCDSTTYKFFYSCLFVSNMCLDLYIHTFCILLELFFILQLAFCFDYFNIQQVFFLT